VVPGILLNLEGKKMQSGLSQGFVYQGIARRVLQGVIAAGLGVAMATQAMAAEPEQSQPVTAEFEQRVKDYILSNPEIVVQAIQLYQSQQQAQKTERVKVIIEQSRAQLLADPEAPVGGNPEGDVTVVAFFDYNCTYCKKVAPVMQALEQQDTELRIVYKEFPILGPVSEYAARAALAADAQGKYLELHNAMMNSSRRLSEALVLGYAADLGLDIDRLKADMQAETISAQFARNRVLARTLGITGTPGFVIGAEIVGGAADQATFENLIARVRQAP
jgi:protein-disulfide isomerase